MNQISKTNASEKKIIRNFYLYTILIGMLTLLAFFGGSYFIIYEFKQNYNENLKNKLIQTQKDFTKQNLQDLVRRIKSSIKESTEDPLQVQKSIMKRIENLRFPNKGYVWIHNSDHRLLMNPYRINDIGKNDKELEDSKGTKIIQMFVKESLKNPNGTFVEYYWKKPDTETFVKKISYLIYLEELDWIIGTGVYIDDLNKHIEGFTHSYENQIGILYKGLIFLFLFIAFLMIFLALKLANDIKKKFAAHSKILINYNNDLQNEVEKRTKELNELNKELQNKISKEVEKNRLQEIKLLEQSKLIQMGEMLENIAHQWRQPLNTISMRASYIKLQSDLGALNTKNMNDALKNIMETTQYLSKTIDVFRNFLLKQDKKDEIVLQNSIDNSLQIIEASFQYDHIKLIKNIDYKDPIKSIQFEGELSQVLINILHNAKDALKTSNTDQRWVKIELKKEDSDAVISIEDNAGGISSDILPKIFDPYFTTKHKSQGTGLGLYMSYKIIKDRFNGELYVENTKNGAKFFIKIPLNS